MQVAIECAGFTPVGGRSAAARHGDLQVHRRRLEVPRQADRRHGRATATTRDFAERTFKQLEGFGSYGFPESHAASLRAHRLCLVLDEVPSSRTSSAARSSTRSRWASTPRRRSCATRASTASRCGPSTSTVADWDCTLEPSRGGAPRRAARPAHGQGPRQLRTAPGSSRARGEAPFASRRGMWRRAGVPVAALEQSGRGRRLRLARARPPRCALGDQGPERQPLPLFAAADARARHARARRRSSPRSRSTPMTAGREVVEDYRSKGLTPAPPSRRLPARRTRPSAASCPCAASATARDGARVTVAGLVLVRQRPGSAKGVMFITLEDETEVANLIVWPSLFERQRRLVLSAGMIAAAAGCSGKARSSTSSPSI